MSEDFKDCNFEYLKDTRFQSLYTTLNATKKLYSVDKGAFLAKLRYALEIVISEVLDICDLQKSKRRSINGNLGLIRECVPESLRQYKGVDIVCEMHNVRIYGNEGSHFDDENDVDLSKAAYTSWIAIKKICKWISTFEEKYEAYKEEQIIINRLRLEEERRKKEERDEEERKKTKENQERITQVTESARKLLEQLLEEERKDKEERERKLKNAFKNFGKVAVAAACVGIAILTGKKIVG